MKKFFLKCFFTMAALLLIFLPVHAGAQKVVIAMGVDVEALDPQFSAGIPSMCINSNVFDTLVSRDQKLKIEYRLATSYKRLSPTTWRFNLRKGVSFHNGEPFNAESVKFTFERLYDPESKSRQKGWFTTIDRIEIIDNHTVDIVTKQPDPIFLARLTMFFIVPPKYATKVGFAGFNLHPVGTGAFKFVKWIRDDRVVLKSYEKYWDGTPEIKDLVFRAIPEAQARLAGLQTGELDLATYIPPDLAVSGNGEYGFRSGLSTRILYLYLSTNKESPLLNEKVRHAINYAIDRDNIIKYILQGYGEKLGPFVPKPVFAHDRSIEPYPYNPQKAKQLLAEAGYPDGFKIDLEGPSGRYMRDKEVCQAIAGQLGEVGITVNLQIVEFTTLIGKITSHTAAPIYLLGWSLPSLDPDSWLWTTFHSGEAFSQINDKELDRLLEQGRFEMDLAKREEIYHKAQRIVYDRAYLAVLYEQKDLFGISKRIEWTPRPDEMIYARDIKLVK